jgi:hypothetical protein
MEVQVEDVRNVFGQVRSTFGTGTFGVWNLAGSWRDATVVISVFSAAGECSLISGGVP